jgi:hypothetical protein
MKPMKNLQQCRSTYDAFTKFHFTKKIKPKTSSEIMGGDPTPQQIQQLLNILSQIFIKNSNCDADLWQEFNNQIAKIATTNVGYLLLNSIATLANGRKIIIDGVNPLPIYNGASYLPGLNSNDGGKIQIGGLQMPAQADRPDRQIALNFGTILHELVHAYQYFGAVPQSYFSSVRSELDAFLIEAMGCNEVDQKQNLTMSNAHLLKSYSYWDHNLYSKSSDGFSDKQFQIIYYDVFHNKNFTLSNYNNMIELFLVCSPQGEGYAQIPPQGGWDINPIDEATFNSSIIKSFYNTYSQSSYFNNIPPFPFLDPNTTAMADPLTDQWGGSNGDGSISGYPSGNMFWFLSLMSGYSHWPNFQPETNNSTGGWQRVYVETTGHYIWVGPNGEISY